MYKLVTKEEKLILMNTNNVLTNCEKTSTGNKSISQKIIINKVTYLDEL